MSPLISLLVIVGTIGSLIGFFLLLHLNRRIKNPGEPTGHRYDGIEELDNPLPAWWYWWFVLTIIFAFGYLIYYPGLGNFQGLGGWSQVSALEQSQAEANQKFGPLYAQYRDVPLDKLVDDPAAMKMGRRMFNSNCSVCHGARGTGSYGFPDLSDEEWIWGSDNEDIETTIAHGRQAAMLAWKDILGVEGVNEVTEHVMKLAGREVDEDRATRGSVHFALYCVACHGADAKGQKLFGAPDLTNKIWLYGGSKGRIAHTIMHGRNGLMPPFAERLGSDKVHILAGYVKSLSSVDD